MLHPRVFQYICYSLDNQFSGQKNGVFQILKYISFIKYVQWEKYGSLTSLKLCHFWNLPGTNQKDWILKHTRRNTIASHDHGP